MKSTLEKILDKFNLTNGTLSKSPDGKQKLQQYNPSNSGTVVLHETWICRKSYNVSYSCLMGIQLLLTTPAKKGCPFCIEACRGSRRSGLKECINSVL